MLGRIKPAFSICAKQETKWFSVGCWLKPNDTWWSSSCGNSLFNIVAVAVVVVVAVVTAVMAETAKTALVTVATTSEMLETEQSESLAGTEELTNWYMGACVGVYRVCFKTTEASGCFC